MTGQVTYQLHQGGGFNPHYPNPPSPHMAMGMGPPATGMAYSPPQEPSYDMTGSSFSSNERNGEFSRTARNVTQAAAFTLLVAGAAKQTIPKPWGGNGRRRKHLARTLKNYRKMGSPAKI